MNHNIFETRHRAEELLAEAVEIWKQEVHSEQLEGLEKDPVFSMLMAAVAYQGNETDAEIERLKGDVLEEYASMLVPYEAAHATPATVMAEMKTQDGVGESDMTSDITYKLGNTPYVFSPVLNTKVIAATVKSATRLDGRRWEVVLSLNANVNDLSYVTFTINNNGFRDLNISIDGKPVKLIRPWEYSEMPYTRNFAIENSIYNQAPSFDASMTSMDLFARHNLRMYCIDRHKPNTYVPMYADSIKMVIEFEGITDNFHFEARQMTLNTVVLANVMQQHTTLDSNQPMARITGGLQDSETHAQYMHMLRPDDSQMHGHEIINVRRVMADRFNQGSLTRLLSTLFYKLHSDFYAFQKLNSRQSTNLLNAMREQTQKLLAITTQDKSASVQGTYLMLRPGTVASVKVIYLLTNGTAVNSHLTQMSKLTAITSNAPAVVQQLTYPMPGTDEISAETDVTEEVRYALITNNRIVTPADIKIFVYSQMQSRYGITRTMVKGIRVSNSPQPANTWHNACGYQIDVTVTLESTPFVKRSFGERIPEAEILLEKMLQVRSANIYPIRLKIVTE